MIDVVCTQSYTDNKIFNVGAKIGTDQASIQAGTCEYQGKTYLALSVADNALDRKSQLSVTYTLRYNGKTLSNTKVMYTNVHSFMVYFTANTFESFTIDSVSPTEDNDYIYVIGTP